MITIAVPAAQEELDELAYALGHDLAAPVRHISAFSRLALRKMETDPASAKELVERLAVSAGHLSAMLDALVFYSRVGRLEEPFETLDVEAMLDEVLDLRRKDLQAKGQSVSFEGGVELVAEPRQVRRCLHEAVDNVVRHAGAGAQATLRVEESDATWTVHIEDDGPGIPEDRLADAMLLFRKIEHSDRPSAGLGLIRRVCRRHGGDAWLVPAAGTHLTMTFAKERP